MLGLGVYSVQHTLYWMTLINIPMISLYSLYLTSQNLIQGGSGSLGLQALYKVSHHVAGLTLLVVRLSIISTSNQHVQVIQEFITGTVVIISHRYTSVAQTNQQQQLHISCRSESSNI